ncbi:MAG: NifB/NifX family molybdenum-iron cluster-binding protein [Candidatus Lokiarchaeota archaeon]|nr:NifB/NifX family molybdenum-iron cluster-binding protein [Candidatus Lokiarchaeota archaeon]
MARIIGIPSVGPDLSDNISAHFGHCEYFVGVELLDDNTLQKAFSLQNMGHSGCMEPVINMKNRNVTDMIVGGIGGRPFMGFLQMGINLYQGVEGSINQNIELLLQGKLKPLGGPSCGGGGHAEGAQCN